MSDAVDRFLRNVAELGIALEVQEMDQSTHTASDAASALGCSVGAIVKSLLFLVHEQPLLVLVAGNNRVNVAALGKLLGASVTMADAKRVKVATGYSIGGVPPFGHPKPLRTIVDQDLLDHPKLWAAAGSGTAVFGISPTRLVELSDGEVMTVS